MLMPHMRDIMTWAFSSDSLTYDGGNDGRISRKPSGTRENHISSQSHKTKIRTYILHKQSENYLFLMQIMCKKSLKMVLFKTCPTLFLQFHLVTLVHKNHTLQLKMMKHLDFMIASVVLNLRLKNKTTVMKISNTLQ